MTTDLATVAPANMTELINFGEYVSKDKWGVVAKMGAAQAYGFHPALYNDVVYLIDNRGEKTWGVSTKAMGALIQKHPKYDYTPVTREAATCTIRFYKKSEMTGEVETYDHTMTRKQADIAGFSKTGKGATKQNWTKFPEQMLFYRCLAEGTRTFCPEVLGGGNAYDVDEIQGARIVKDDVIEVEAIEVSVDNPDVEIIAPPVETKPVDEKLQRAIQWCRQYSAKEIPQLKTPQEVQDLARRALTRVLEHHGLETDADFEREWIEASPQTLLDIVIDIFESGKLG